MKFFPGHTFTVERRFTQAEFDDFARLSGDDNPIHVDPAFAARTPFGRPVAHGMLLYSAVCGALSQALPGAIQLNQRFIFPAPTYAGDPLTITLTVLEAGPEPGQIRLSTTIAGPDGTITCDGETLLQWQ